MRFELLNNSWSDARWDVRVALQLAASSAARTVEGRFTSEMITPLPLPPLSLPTTRSIVTPQVLLTDSQFNEYIFKVVSLKNRPRVGFSAHYPAKQWPAAVVPLDSIVRSVSCSRVPHPRSPRYPHFYFRPSFVIRIIMMLNRKCNKTVGLAPPRPPAQTALPVNRDRSFPRFNVRQTLTSIFTAPINLL